MALLAEYGFHEGTGTTTADSSGNNRTATVATDTLRIAGHATTYAVKAPAAAVLDQIAVPKSGMETAQRTMMCWAKVTVTGIIQYAARFRNAADSGVWGILPRWSDTESSARIKIGGVNTDLVAANSNLTSWCHYAITYDGATFKFYIDGTLANSQAVTGTIDSATNGVDITDNGSIVDDVRFYDTALSQSEIQALMNTPVSGTSPLAVFSDNFNRANGSIGATWAVNTGSVWTVASNQAVAPSGIGMSVWHTPCTTDDNYAQVTLPDGSGGYSRGVVARSSGGDNGYVWRYNGSDCSLFRAVSGTYTLIGTAYSGALANGTVMKITAVGSTITGYINGVAVRSGTDTNITTGKYVGMRAITPVTLDDWFGGDIATGRPKVWNGSAWAQKPAKVWNGSAQVEKPVKVWNGSTWATVK